MTEIYYLRHAEPDFRCHEDCIRPLTQRGLSERFLAVDFLEQRKIQGIYSSPYRRAVDTVRPLADRLGLSIVLEDAFRERMVGEVWVEDFTTYSRRQWQDFSYKLCGGESLLEVQTRNVKAMRKVLREHRNEAVVIAGHGTALSTLWNYFVPVFGYEGFQRIKNKMPFVVRFCFHGDQLLGIEEFPFV